MQLEIEEYQTPWFNLSDDGDKAVISQMRRLYSDSTAYYHQTVELTREEAAILAAKLLRFAATDET